MTASKKDWERVRALFDAVIVLPESRRLEALQRECGSEPELLAEVESLMAAAGADDAEFSDIVRAAATAATGAQAADQLEQRVGSYRLIDLLGTGGMGNVYLAERADEQFEQRVAIKLLHPGRRDRDLIHRFRTERQLLANLEHPNIARLLDGGETDSGIPYLVMEYIDGEPVDTYCDAHRLTVAERLRLFQKICSAVEYAHRNLVVHRDIKPSNILVTVDGEPKLLDFGIAKLLDETLVGGPAALTRAGVSIMTPEFASPEQVRAEPVSTATDLYSLGVLLYRMLCGRMPYTRQGPYTDLARAIVEEEPGRPSTALTSHRAGSADSSEHISAARDTSVSGLASRLRGDLDNIVLKALRKKPENRYASARDFADDIERYLTHRPVSAVPASIGYRAAKLLRRHRAAAIVAAVMAATLTGSVVQIVLERNRAELAAIQSEEVVRYLGELFASASPARAQSEEITAHDLLEQGVAEIDSLEDQPAVQARLLEIMGTSFFYIGEQERSAALLERALDIRRHRLAYDPAAVGNVLRLLSTPNRLSGRLDEAEQNLVEAYALLTEAYGPVHGRVAYVLNLTGDVLRFQERHEEAVDHLRRAVAMKEQLGETDDEDMVDILGNLAVALDAAGRLDEAEAISRRTVAASRAMFGDKQPNTLIRIGNLGLVQVRLGNYAEALKNVSEAYDSINEVWASDPHRTTWAAAIKAFALLYAGRFDEALAAQEEKGQLELEHYGRDTLRYAKTLMDIGEVHLRKARYAEADRYLLEAIATASRIGEDPGFRAGSIRMRLAMLHIATGDYERAEATAREALAVPSMLGTATRLSLQRELARALSNQGRYDEATALFETSLSGREAFNSPTSVSLLPTLMAMSRHYRRAGQPDRALELASRAHSIGQTVTPAGTWEPAFASAEYALALMAGGDDAAAVPILEQAVRDLTATFGTDDPRVSELRRELPVTR